MEARFSAVDDKDELATRLYIVIGRLDRYFPSVTARLSCGGSYQRLDLSEIAEPLEEGFPAEWLERVEPEQKLFHPSERHLTPRELLLLKVR